jgi:hypothetical protein
MALKSPRTYQLFPLKGEVLRQDRSVEIEESLMTGDAKLCVCVTVNNKAIKQCTPYCGVCNETCAFRRNFDEVEGGDIWVEFEVNNMKAAFYNNYEYIQSSVPVA